MTYLTKKSSLLLATGCVLALLAGGAALYKFSAFKPEPRTSAAQGQFLKISEVKTDSGITAWLVEDHSLPLLSLEFAFRGAGAVNESPEKQGLSRLVSNTMDEGSGTRDAQAFQKTLDDNSITLRFSSSRDDFYGSLKTLTRRQDLAFDLLHDALTTPRFEPEAVERMRAANIARIKSSLSDPGWLAARLINDVAFAGHPYALNSGGTLSTLAALRPDDLRGFVSRYMTRDRLVIAATGDITPQQLSRALDTIFGALPATGAPDSIADLAPQNAGQIVLYKHDSPQTFIQAMSPGVGRDDPDYPAFQVMNFIFGGGGFGSRLTETVREKRGLTYGIDTSPYLLDHTKALMLSTSTENKNASEVLDLIRAEMTLMRTTPVTAQELSDAQSYITGSLPLALTSTDDISSLALGLQLDHLPPDYMDTYPKAIKSVKIEDIQRLSAMYLDPDRLSIAVVGQPEKISPTRTVDQLPNVE